MTMSKQNVFVVFAHWNRKASLNGALLDIAVETLTADGHNVDVSDLYAMDFNPVLSYKDAGLENEPEDYYNYEAICKDALKQNTICPEIAEEHKKLEAADLVIFQFPLTWQGFPAIMKGWVDRCFTCGVVHDFESQAVFDKGLMKGKKAMLSFTVACNEQQSGPAGAWGDMEVLLWPIHNGVLHYAGFEVLAPNITYLKPSKEERVELVQEWKKRLHSVFDEKPLTFLPTSMFKKNNFVLDEKDIEDQTIGYNVGQHLGKGFIAGNMMKPAT